MVTQTGLRVHSYAHKGNGDVSAETRRHVRVWILRPGGIRRTVHISLILCGVRHPQGRLRGIAANAGRQQRRTAALAGRQGHDDEDDNDAHVCLCTTEFLHGTGVA